MSSSHLSPKATTALHERGEIAVFASEPIVAGETVAAFGGRCVTRRELKALAADRQIRSIQIDEHLFLAGEPEPEPVDFVRHSCEPNCGLRNGVLLVAMRDVAPGEELSYDYATSDCSDEGFDCSCGAPACRGRITGGDWMLPELQLRYRGYFSPYLAARISRLVTTGAERRAFAL